MGPLTSLLLWLLGAHMVFPSPVSATCGKRNNNCPKCPAGHFLKKESCECFPCAPGRFISDSNCERSCQLCFRDCTKDLHMKVVKNCSRTSNLQCECEEGFTCTSKNFNGFCVHCQRSQDLLMAVTQRSTPSQPSASNQFGPTSISGNATVPRTTTEQQQKDITQNQLISILCPLVILGGLSLMLILCNKTRFKQTVTKLCTEAKDPKTRKTSELKQQTVPMATANMGSVHVHNPGTVIFSLLGEVSGQMGQTNENTEVKGPSEEDAYCTVCQPTTSPCFPLSKEEHPGDHVFFPSQEQGKDSCVSMEE